MGGAEPDVAALRRDDAAESVPTLPRIDLIEQHVERPDLHTEWQASGRGQSKLAIDIGNHAVLLRNWTVSYTYGSVFACMNDFCDIHPAPD